MKKVMAQGTFDILHPGHIHYLEKSAELGDELVVVISRDSRNEDRNLYFSEDERKLMVDSLECVEAAILGSESDIYSTVERIDPGIITLGYDQGHDEEDVKEMAEKATGHEMEVVRISGKKGYSSSDIRS